MTSGKGVVGGTLGALFVLALVSCLHYSSAWAREPDPVPPSQGERIGEIKRTQGAVSVTSAGRSAPQPAGENDPVFIQDTLGTDQAGKAWWRSGSQGAAPQQGDASLGESSALEFVRFDEDGTSSDFSGVVGQGMVRFIKDLPRSVPLSRFIISTPTAGIEVLSTDRPADFVVEVREDRKLTTVYGIWGAVKVRHMSGQFVQERIVRSCQRVDVEDDKEPTQVIGVSPETLKELIRKTTIPDTLPEEVPLCRDGAVAEPSVIYEDQYDVMQPPYFEDPPVVVGCPCPEGREQVGGVCVDCPRWKMYDRLTCSCVYRCRYDNQCRRCETCRNGLCVSKACPPGQWLDRKTCTCMRGCPPLDCPQGFRFNPKTCRCERTPCDKKCPPGQWLDEKTCTCRGECPPRDCPQGFWFNPKTCECERRPCDKKCPPGQWLDEKTCTCVHRQTDCNRKCPPGQRLDPETCRCVPKCLIKCRPGEWLDLENCRCEPRCRKECPPGQRLDPVACKCVGEGTVPRRGCRSDGDCGPGSVCRDQRCVSKEDRGDKIPRQPDHPVIPSQPRPKPDKPVIPSQPRPKPDQPVIPSQPRPKPDHPVIPSQPSRPKPDQPAIPSQPRPKPDQPAQPQQKRDQRM
ncbi:MAG: hypothetical protein V2B18_08160 [Pseudomonadota bacterium]